MRILAFIFLWSGCTLVSPGPDVTASELSPESVLMIIKGENKASGPAGFLLAAGVVTYPDSLSGLIIEYTGTEIRPRVWDVRVYHRSSQLTTFDAVEMLIENDCRYIVRS